MLREIFADVRFRQAVAVAINREEINDVVFLRRGTPRAATANKSASFFDERWADYFAQHNPELTNQLLDNLGLDQRGGDGIRLRPDGVPLTLFSSSPRSKGPSSQCSN